MVCVLLKQNVRMLSLLKTIVNIVEYRIVAKCKMLRLTQRLLHQMAKLHRSLQLQTNGSQSVRLRRALGQQDVDHLDKSQWT